MKFKAAAPETSPPEPMMTRLGARDRRDLNPPAGSAESSKGHSLPSTSDFSFGKIEIFPRHPVLQAKSGAGRPEGVPGSRRYGGAHEIAAAGLSHAGSALPFKQEIEALLGVPLDGVRAHTDSEARNATSRLGAYGFASGDHIAFGTASPSKKLVAHEVTHVLQQRSGATPDAGVGHPNDRYEHEADQVAELIGADRSARHVGRAYTGGPSVSSGPGVLPEGKHLNALLREMLTHPRESVAPVQFDLKADLRGMLDIIGPPHYEGVIRVIQAAPVVERRAAVVDAGILDLIRMRFGGVWGTSIISSLLEGSQNWDNPPATDFYAFFVLRNGTGTLPTTATMNCWESIMYAAYLAGVLSAAWIKNYYVSAGALPGTTVDPTPRLWAQLGFSTSLPTYDVAAGRVPALGQLVFYVTAGSPIPGHVAVYMGGGQVMSLWTKPHGIRQVQRIAITDIAGTIYYGNPPW